MDCYLFEREIKLTENRGEEPSAKNEQITIYSIYCQYAVLQIGLANTHTMT